MIDRGRGWRRLAGWPASLAAAALLLAAGAAVAQPLVKELPRAAPLVLVEQPASTPAAPAADGGEIGQNAPLAELTEALAAARAKLEQLDRAAAALAGAAALRAELAAKEEESRGLRAELQTLRARRAEWQRAQDAAQAEITGLAQALEEAAAEAKQLDGELAAVRWRNAQLHTSLEAAQAGQDAARAETEAVRAELQAALDAAGGDLERVRGQLGATAARLNEVNAALAAAERERDAAQADLEKERASTARLRDALTAAEADLAQAKAGNRDLTMRLAGLEEAAMLATDAARQNLLAVEHQVAALNSTLAKADLAPSDGTAVIPAAATRSLGADEPEPAAGPGTPSAAERALLEMAGPPAAVAAKPIAELTAALPVESRIQAQSLLADLAAETEPQGVKLLVPGAELFTTNGQEVRDTAYESLAKVAELINLYKSQPVLIIGHTDAIGAPDYNQTLSERRAGLVRRFFIDHFDVEAARLSTQGMGEQQPIASNATAAGRRANRRVEVLILN